MKNSNKITATHYPVKHLLTIIYTTLLSLSILACTEDDEPTKIATPQSFLLSRPDAEAQSSVILQWAPVPGATGYQIQQRQGSNGWQDLLLGLMPSSTQATITELIANTVYSFRIRALKFGHDSDYSQAISVTTLAKTATALSNAPSNFKASAPKDIARQSTGVDLTWTVLTESAVAGYEIQYHTKNEVWHEATLKSVADKSTDILNLNDLKAETKFYFRIRGIAALTDSTSAPSAWSPSAEMIYPADKAALQTLVNSRIKSTASPDLRDIYTAKVTDMSNLFSGLRDFNGDISNWNTANVTDMSRMFAFATAFNQDIGKWDTANVTDMTTMFYNASAFDQNLSQWNVRKVTKYSDIFLGSAMASKTARQPSFQDPV